MASESTQPGSDVAVAAPAPTSPRGKGFLALSGGTFLHGLGHVIAGRYRRGLFWFALSWGLVAINLICAMVRSLMPLLIVLMPLSFIATIWCLVDSFLIGRRSERRMLGRAGLRYLAGAGIIAAVILLNPALWVALQIRSHLIEAFVIPTGSMEPALIPGDRFIINKRQGYGRWSVVGHDSLHNRSVKFAKRIVALPGETIEIVDGEVVINGHTMQRPAGVAPYRDPPELAKRLGANDLHHTTLGKDEYFVIGDNSIISADSRLWTVAAPGHQPGMIPADYIVGPVTAIYWPPRRWRRFE